jgi:HAMP domain-containing protein
VNRLAPSLLVLIVTVLDLAYGRFAWSWLAGPVVGLLLWSLRDVAATPAAPAPARARREPALVD